MTFRTGLLAAAAALVPADGAWANDAAEPSVAELKKEVAALRSRVATLEGQQGADWLTEQRSAEIRGLIADVMADAETRASLLRGTSAGYDDGFVLASGDGDWLLRTNLLMQQRFLIGSQDDDDRWSFENSRTRFTLSGNVVSPEWFYRVQIDIGANGGGLPAGSPGPGLPFDARTGTLDAYVGYDFGNGFQMWGGTFTAPLLREELIDASRQQAVERSVLNYIFTAGRVDGIAMGYTGEDFRMSGSYHDGSRTMQSPFDVADTRFAFTIRGEYLVEGQWDQFDDLTSPRGDDRGIMFGGAVHFQTEDSAAPDLDLLTFTADASLEFGGGNLFAAVIFSNIDSGGFNEDLYGLLVQAGYYLNDTWEMYGRIEWADLAVGAVDDTLILTVGVNKYFGGPGVRWTTDVGIGFNQVGLAPDVTGFRPDGPGEDGQVVIRSQLQVAF